MSDPRPCPSQDLEELLRNAELRDELEPYYDEAISRVNVQRLPLNAENEFLASMLAWEMAPILPICQWFDPPMAPPNPGLLADGELRAVLEEIVGKLFEKRIVLDFTDHLSDRELYCLIYRDILPAREKKIDSATNYLHWDCAGAWGDPETWLRYYASDDERQAWSEANEQLPPPRAVAKYPRHLPAEPD
jgi:hypothetical protein